MDFLRWQFRPDVKSVSLRILGGMFALAMSSAYADEPLKVAALVDMSFEELANIEVTSVSKHAEKLSDAAASIFVITGDDIRRSGANSIPEALRLAPNLDVAQVNSTSYAISARGFNNAIGNKLLVLIDGRSVYTPLFSGVDWEMQNVMLDDVDRIEVISGPGATLWGANAVNGVINIITKRAEDTQGGLVTASTGNRSSDGAIRYGGKLGDNGYYRVYGMGLGRGSTQRNGVSANDGWSNRQGGFRADWSAGDDRFTVQGDSYEINLDGNAFGTPTRSGSNLLTRWNRDLDDGASLEIQAYYDHIEHNDPTTFNDREDTYDIQLQHSFQWSDSQRITWGGGSRYDSSDTQANYLGTAQALFEFIPAEKGLRWNNIFVQDEIALSQRLKLTLGLKAESNVYSGVDRLPTIRLAWKLNDTDLLWGAWSRAARAPARADRDFNESLYIPNVIKVPIIGGGPNFQSETAKDIEVGYRSQPNGNVSYSITAFYTVYDNLRSGQPGPTSITQPPAFIQNMMNGTTMGVESWATWQLLQSWRLSGGFTVMKERFTFDPGSTDPDGSTDAANDPALTWNLRSSFNLTSNHELDIMVRRIGALPSPAIPAYTAADLNATWKVTPKLDLSLSARNLFNQGHIEFSSSTTALVANAIGRNIALKARLAF
jgi:iron complex outermembrane receptor protein